MGEKTLKFNNIKVNKKDFHRAKKAVVLKILLIPVIKDFRPLLFIESFQYCDPQFVKMGNACVYGGDTLISFCSIG